MRANSYFGMGCFGPMPPAFSTTGLWINHRTATRKCCSCRVQGINTELIECEKRGQRAAPRTKSGHLPLDSLFRFDVVLGNIRETGHINNLEEGRLVSFYVTALKLFSPPLQPKLT
uniref:Uncharacterized protein n=1 Tax=Sphaerodactylus townsendi TaxID=933632 RepID=A0ACB8FKA6_9SAUR